MSFPNAVFSAVFVPSPPELKLIPFCFLSGFPVGAWLLYALPSITYTGWRVIPFCPIWGDFRNHLKIRRYWGHSKFKAVNRMIVSTLDRHTNPENTRLSAVPLYCFRAVAG